MSKTFIDDQDFQDIDYSEQKLAKADYENCIFVNCIFSNTSLSEINFVECRFENCDLSMADISKTGFREVQFKDCKLLGLHFEHCNTFLLSVAFESCLLNLSSFYQLSLSGTKFMNCSLQEVDFGETDLTGSTFKNCDLSGAMFDRTMLEKADLRTSFNFSIDPEKNQIRKAKFSKTGIVGLLGKYDIEIE